MAIKVRSSPSVSEAKDFRADEYFKNSAARLLRMVGTVTVDVPSIAAGGRQTFTIAVNEAKADKQHTVQLALPSTFNQNLLPYAYVSADGVVTVVFFNPTGAPIDLPSATYGCRVMP